MTKDKCINPTSPARLKQNKLKEMHAIYTMIKLLKPEKTKEMKAAREKGCIIREQGFEWLQRRHEAQKAGEQYF